MTMKGGKPSVIGTFFGALLLKTVYNGMNLVGVKNEYQDLVAGLVLIIGITFAYVIKNRVEKRTAEMAT